MPAVEKIYHIYAKDKCIFHSLKEEEFKITWNALEKLVELLNTEYARDDLSYEELLINREVLLNSSH